MQFQTTNFDGIFHLKHAADLLWFKTSCILSFSDVKLWYDPGALNFPERDCKYNYAFVVSHFLAIN